MSKPRLQVKNKTKGCGFTLIELLVVIAIISLMASVGGGMLLGTYKKLNVDKAASNLFLTAKYARMMAVEQQILIVNLSLSKVISYSKIYK